MNDDQLLRTRMRELIKAGRLPASRPERMWGGFGVGEPCLLCGASVKHDEVCLEAEYTPVDGAGAMNHYFHARCLAAAEIEWRHVEQPTSTGGAYVTTTAGSSTSGFAWKAD